MLKHWTVSKVLSYLPLLKHQDQSSTDIDNPHDENEALVSNENTEVGATGGATAEAPKVEEEEEVDIDLDDPDVQKATEKIQAGFKNLMRSKKK